MNATLILSTDGNKVTLCTGFNDVPKHHQTIKRKAITNSYPKQVRREINLRIEIKNLQKRIKEVENRKKLWKHFETLYVLLSLINFIDVLIEAQNYE